MFSLTLTLFLISMIFRTYSESSKIFNPPHFVTGITMLIMWISWFALNDTDPFKYSAHPQLTHAGTGILIMGSIIFASGVLMVITGLIKKQLVSSFIFSKIRHPMYYGMILWLLGYPLFVSSMTGFLAAPAGIACILIWRHNEEQACLKNLDGYAEYMQKTWF